MVNLGNDEIVKYPFLTEAGKYLNDKGFSLEQFGSDPDLKKIVDNAFDRIITSSEGRIFKSDPSSNNSALPLEIFSFLIAVILLKLSGMNTLIRRFSLAEARRAEKFLEKDLMNHQDATKTKLSLQILQELFSVTVEKTDETFTILVSDYLKHSINFHEREWKLINRRVTNGKVHLTPHETVRLVRKELDRHIYTKINSSESKEFPPCIKHAIEVLEKGENLPHSGRFMLATFLLNKGQTVEQIAPLFKNAPDYNPKVTIYQLNQLSGTSGTTEYKCPSCEKVKSQDLCFPVPACDNIINPLQFGRKRV